MASKTWTQTYTYRDSRGDTATVRMFSHDQVDSPATAFTWGEGVRVALDAMTNASFQSAHGPYEVNPTMVTYGLTSEYETVEDKAVLTYTTADGSLHRYRVPAPKLAIFEPDAETVNPDNALVVALNGALIVAESQTLSARDGVLLAQFVGGQRERVKLIRRETIFRKGVTLVIPGE